MSHTDKATSPYHPPQSLQAVGAPPRLSPDRIFFGLVAVVALPLGAWYGKQSVFYAQRAMPNDHLVAISNGSLTLGLILVSTAAIFLASRMSGFAESHRSRVTGVASALAVTLLTVWGGLFAFLGARQGIVLLISCVVWACTSIFERNRRDQNAFTPLRWSLRTIAVVVALPIFASGATLVFDAMNLYNKLHLRSSIPIFNRMSANIPESDAMIFGNLLFGIPFVVIGLLLLREAFRGFVLFAPSVPSDSMSK